MEARLTQRRLLMGTAVLVGLVALTTGCGGGSDAQPSAQKHDPPLAKYSSAAAT